MQARVDRTTERLVGVIAECGRTEQLGIRTQLGVNGLQGGIPGFARGRPSLRDQAGDAGQDAEYADDRLQPGAAARRGEPDRIDDEGRGQAGVSQSRELSVGPSRVNVCSIRGWSCRRSVPRSWRG